MEKRVWTTNEPLPEQKRWRVSRRENESYLEIESDSLGSIIWVLFTFWKLQAKEKIKTYINKKKGK